MAYKSALFPAIPKMTSFPNVSKYKLYQNSKSLKDFSLTMLYTKITIFESWKNNFVKEWNFSSPAVSHKLKVYVFLLNLNFFGTYLHLKKEIISHWIFYR